MFGEFTGQKEVNGGLDLITSKGSLVVVTGKVNSLVAESLEGIDDEGVHDRHGTLGNADLTVNLLQHTIDVGGVGLGSSSLAVRNISLLLRALGALARCLSHWISRNSKSEDRVFGGRLGGRQEPEQTPAAPRLFKMHTLRKTSITKNYFHI